MDRFIAAMSASKMVLAAIGRSRLSKGTPMRYHPDFHICGHKHLPFYLTVGAGLVATAAILMSIKKLSCRLHEALEAPRKEEIK